MAYPSPIRIAPISLSCRMRPVNLARPWVEIVQKALNDNIKVFFEILTKDIFIFFVRGELGTWIVRDLETATTYRIFFLSSEALKKQVVS
ncbi:hypothetical protein GB937_001253 [Aspergillus fischeri]|nr:hypothetical protein GB937_001253 [Aspergillus fischeri]